MSARTRHPATVLAVAVAVAIAAATACRPAAPPADPQLVAEWVHALYGAMRVERLSPPVASRTMAYASSALYAGMRTGYPAMAPLSVIVPNAPSMPEPDKSATYDATIVAVAAETALLDSLMSEALPTTRTALHRLADSLVAARRALGIDSVVHARSAALGARMGQTIALWAGADGFRGTRGRAYAAPVGESLWVNDAPATTFATQSTSGMSEIVVVDNPANQQRTANMSDRALILSRPKFASVKTMPAVNMSGASEPYWHEIRPFVLSRWDECAVPTPPTYTTDTSSVLYRNARAVFDRKRTLTDDERTIAYFWADNAGESGTPVGHWLSIASQMVSERKLAADEAARLMLATSLAQADAFIAAWGYKYQFNVVRPRTYIRRVIDSTWEPLISTPPFPEFPSGHSAQSSAAAAAIAGVIGESAFTDSTGISIGHAVRHFPSFTAASEEAGLSRVLGGIHYPDGNKGGLALGRCIGAHVVARFDSTRTGGASR